MTAVPLNELLSSALPDLTRAIGEPSLPVYANLLRLLGDDGLGLRDVPALARVSKRAARSDVVIATRNGWVEVSDTRIRLTSAGRTVRNACEDGLRAADVAWRQRFGDDLVTKLRRRLEALVAQLDLELPHHPAGYGPADPSVTGGVMTRWGRGHALRANGMPGPVFDPGAEHDLAEAWERESGGRLYVRETGQDWRPVVRADGDTVSGLPLSALLSQALMAFAIDYEGSGGLSLARSGNVLRSIDDDGIEVEVRQARARGKVIVVPVAAGLAGLERHAFGSVTTDPADPKKGRFTLTEKGRLVRDAYDGVVGAIERRWQRRYGAALVRELRSTLLRVAKEVGIE